MRFKEIKSPIDIIAEDFELTFTFTYNKPAILILVRLSLCRNQADKYFFY